MIYPVGVSIPGPDRINKIVQGTSGEAGGYRIRNLAGRPAGRPDQGQNGFPACVSILKRWLRAWMVPVTALEQAVAPWPDHTGAEFQADRPVACGVQHTGPDVRITRENFICGKTVAVTVTGRDQCIPRVYRPDESGR